MSCYDSREKIAGGIYLSLTHNLIVLNKKDSLVKVLNLRSVNGHIISIKNKDFQMFTIKIDHDDLIFMCNDKSSENNLYCNLHYRKCNIDNSLWDSIRMCRKRIAEEDKCTIMDKINFNRYKNNQNEKLSFIEELAIVAD